MVKRYNMIYSLSYHEATGDVWLKHFVEGAAGERAAVEGEDLGHVAHALFVMSAALKRHRGLRAVGAGLVLHCARGVEYSAEVEAHAVACRVAGVDGWLGITLRLRPRHERVTLKMLFKIIYFSKLPIYNIHIMLNDKTTERSILLLSHCVLFTLTRWAWSLLRTWSRP